MNAADSYIPGEDLSWCGIGCVLAVWILATTAERMQFLHGLAFDLNGSRPQGAQAPNELKSGSAMPVRGRIKGLAFTALLKN